MKALWGQVLGILLARLIELGVLTFLSCVPFSHMVDLKGKAVNAFTNSSNPPEETSLAPGYSS